MLNRYFYAIRPAGDALAAIAAERRSHRLDRPVRDDHAHVTMEIIDDHARPPHRLIDTLVAIGAGIDASGFALALNRIVGTTRSIALRPAKPSAGLSVLHRALRDRVGRAGLSARQGWSFSPHLTLGYRDAPAFSRAISPIGWPVAEFVLVHSFVGETRHETIGRWALGADPQLSLF